MPAQVPVRGSVGFAAANDDLRVRGDRRHRLAVATMILCALLEVVFGPLWAWLGANERPTDATIYGAALILAALAANELFAAKRMPRQANPKSTHPSWTLAADLLWATSTPRTR